MSWCGPRRASHACGAELGQCADTAAPAVAFLRRRVRAAARRTLHALNRELCSCAVAAALAAACDRSLSQRVGTCLAPPAAGRARARGARGVVPACSCAALLADALRRTRRSASCCPRCSSTPTSRPSCGACAADAPAGRWRGRCLGPKSDGLDGAPCGADARRRGARHAGAGS